MTADAEPFDLPVEAYRREPDPDAEAHAYFSPSASERWLTCTRAPLEEAGKVDRGNPASRRGTKLHGVSERILLKYDNAEAAFNAIEEKGDRDAVMFYVRYVRDRLAACGPHAVLKVEVRTRFHPKSWGTSDVVIIDGRRLIVIDAKFGAIPVWASWHETEVDADGETWGRERPNSQLGIYGLGALKKYEAAGFEFDEVELVIVQPVAIEAGKIEEPSSFVIPVTRLRAEGEIYQASIELPDSERVYAPSEDTCRWCKAKTDCPALNAVKDEAAQDMFAELVPADFEADGFPTDLAPVDNAVTVRAPLHRKLALVPMLRAWCRAQEEEAETLLMLGEKVQGFKVVRGNCPARKWRNHEQQADAIEAALQSAGVDKAVEQYKPAQPLTPTQLEKALKDDGGMKPKEAKALVADFVIQGDGRLKVVEHSHRSPEVTAKVLAEEDFAGIEQGDEG